jgi:hypothetical protein
MKTIIKTYCTLLFILVANLASVTSYGQTSFKLSDLQGKVWIQQGLGNQLNEEQYENQKLVITLNKKYTVEFEYYLSDNLDNSFDQSKVGKIMEGKYIIRRALRDNSAQTPIRVSTFEIIELSQNKLVLKNSKQNLLEYLSK